MASEANRSIVVWALADGRPGHWNQVRGLADALGRLTAVCFQTIDAPTRWQSARNWLTRSWRETRDLPSPDIIIGAGHRTHVPMLLARRLRGGRTVVLMSPSLPTRWFDLCLAPDHETTSHKNVIATRGAINRVQRSDRRDADEGTILIGGPSRHVDWNSTNVVSQVAAICGRSPDVNWQLSTSRRTPPDVIPSLRALSMSNTKVLHVSETTSDWLPERLAISSRAWVTADSISMVYECLTAGSAVGVINVALKDTNGKVARSLDGLVETGSITKFADWQATGALATPTANLDEANRCAREIMLRFQVSDTPFVMSEAA